MTDLRAPTADLRELVRSGAITEQQAALLQEGWWTLGSDWPANPYLCSIPEHSRAYIDQWRQADLARLTQGVAHVQH